MLTRAGAQDSPVSRRLWLRPATLELREARSHFIEALLHHAFTAMMAARDAQRFGKRGDKFVDRLQLLAVVAVAIGAPPEEQCPDRPFLVGEREFLDELGIIDRRDVPRGDELAAQRSVEDDR